MFTQEVTMNDVPRSYLTPADRDAQAFEASRLRALALRQEAIEAFWHACAGKVRTAFHTTGEAIGRIVLHTHKEA
jgi:hypothetical protein